MEQLHTHDTITQYFWHQITDHTQAQAQARERAQLRIIQTRKTLAPLTDALQTCFAGRSIHYHCPDYVGQVIQPGTLNYFEDEDLPGLEYIAGLELAGRLIVTLTVDAHNVTLIRGIKTTIVPHQELHAGTIDQFTREIAAYIVPQLTTTEVQPCKAQWLPSSPAPRNGS